MPPRLKAKERRLLALLERWRETYHRREFLDSDPLRFAHRYSNPADQEVAALIAAAFASGNIKAINAVLEAIFEQLGAHPAQWLIDHSPAELEGSFEGVYHRWVTSRDLERFLALIGEALRSYGSLAALWSAGDDPDASDTTAGLTHFTEALTAPAVEPLAPRLRQMSRADGSQSALSPVETILLTSPRKGSACKRMHLFLRWVSRPMDGVDLGLWTEFLSPSRLTIPVDTHILQFARVHGLTDALQPTRRAAIEITEALRRIAPEDPVRYDFAIVRGQIMEGASGKTPNARPS